jgi:hypothetical protein
MTPPGRHRSPSCWHGASKSCPRAVLHDTATKGDATKDLHPIARALTFTRTAGVSTREKHLARGAAAAQARLGGHHDTTPPSHYDTTGGSSRNDAAGSSTHQRIAPDARARSAPHRSRSYVHPHRWSLHKGMHLARGAAAGQPQRPRRAGPVPSASRAFEPARAFSSAAIVRSGTAGQALGAGVRGRSQGPAAAPSEERYPFAPTASPRSAEPEHYSAIVASWSCETRITSTCV